MDIESRSRTGMPNSLAFHVMGLLSFTSNSNMDTNRLPISSDQISKVKRMRYLNRMMKMVQTGKRACPSTKTSEAIWDKRGGHISWIRSYPTGDTAFALNACDLILISFSEATNPQPT